MMNMIIMINCNNNREHENNADDDNNEHDDKHDVVDIRGIDGDDCVVKVYVTVINVIMMNIIIMMMNFRHCQKSVHL